VILVDGRRKNNMSTELLVLKNTGHDEVDYKNWNKASLEEMVIEDGELY
jgi:hypothetical protein